MSVLFNYLRQINVSFALLIVLAIVLCVFLISRLRLYYLAWMIPGPWGYPFIGSLLQLMDTDKMIPVLEFYHYIYGETVKMFVGTWLVVCISKPQHLQVILNNFLEKERRFYHRTFDFIEEGLVFLDVEPWRVHRRIINPAFNQKILDTYMGIFTTQSQLLAKILQKEVGKPAFDAFGYINRCSMDIICETAMNTQVGCQTKAANIFKTFSRVLQVLSERIFRVWLHIDWVWFISSRGKEYLKLKDVIHTYTSTIIENKRTQLKEQQKNNIKEEEEEGTIKRKTFLEILLEGEGSTFTEKELRHEVSTFVNTGTDTIALASSYVLLALAMHPRIQENVFDELQQVFGNSDRLIELEDLPQLTYLEQVMKETMRLYPPVPVVARRVDKELDLGDYILPAQTSAFISVFGVHRNPEIWKDPLKFDPNRFTPEECAKRHFYSWIPFLGGPRMCIGYRYAMMLMKVILSTVLRTYVVKTDIRPKDIKFNYEVILKPIGGFQIMLENRKPIATDSN